MQYSVVPFSKIKIDSNCLRVDAEFFRSEFLDVEKLLKKEGFKTLKDYEVKIYHPNEIKRQYTDSENGIRFLRAQNVRPFFADLESNPVFIDEQDAQKLNKNKIKNNDILITRTGANFGQCCIYLNNDNPIASSHTFICKSGDLEAEFLMIFLNSKYGRRLLDKGMYGGVQPEIAPFYIYNIPIPNISKDFQKLISISLRLSSSLIESSKSLYNEAENLLLEELGLKDWKPKHQLSYVKNYSETQKAERFDAEYFQPQYDEIINVIMNYHNGFDIVKGQFDLINGKTPDFYSDFEDEVQVLKTKQIHKQYILYNGLSYSKEKNISTLLQEKDVLLASMGVGSLGRVGIFYNFETNKKTSIDSTIKIFRKIGFIEPEVLQVFFNSAIGQEYIYKYVVGSTGIISVKSNMLQNIKIPMILPDVQTNISGNIVKSHKLNKQSKSLL